jgi:predicted RNA-binding protein associated with RNAse of E/G family
MRALSGITSGQWQTSAHLHDYRTEWFSSMLVERATWMADAPVQRIGDMVVASPGYVWLRFWLLESDDVIEKYLDARGAALGYYIPICTPLDRRGTQLYVGVLKLALWMRANGQLTVLGEKNFEQAIQAGELTPVEAEHAEYRIRTLTTAIHQKRFPPAMIRNFTLAQ